MTSRSIDDALELRYKTREALKYQKSLRFDYKRSLKILRSGNLIFT